MPPPRINGVTTHAFLTNAFVNADYVTLSCLRTPSTLSSADVVIPGPESMPLDLSSRGSTRIRKRPTGDAASVSPNAVRSPSNPTLCHQIRQVTRPRHAQEKCRRYLHTTAATRLPVPAPEQYEELALNSVARTV